MPSILNATTTSGLVTSADNSGSLQLQTNSGTTAVTIDTSQNVGIGTTNPTNKLQVNGSLGVLDENLQFRRTGQTTWNMTNFNSNLYFNNGSDRMIITSGGEVLIGTTSTIGSAGELLHVRTVNGGSRAIAVGNSTGSSLTGCINFQNSNGVVGAILTGGTSTTYSTSSDYRLKENIKPMTDALAKVQALKPVTYTWKTDGSAGQGFIAHELQAVVPDCVSGDKDAVETYTDEEGNEQTRPVYQGVDTSFLVATLTAAIQELKAELNEVKAELDATKAEVQALKGVA